jgi:hypothetical protein
VHDSFKSTYLLIIVYKDSESSAIDIKALLMRIYMKGRPNIYTHGRVYINACTSKQELTKQYSFLSPRKSKREIL